jgi:hypothetical protein
MENLCKICQNNTQLLFNLDLINVSCIYNMKNVNIVSCTNCGFCFNNKISQEDCNEYYSNSNNYTNALYKKPILQHDRYNHFTNLLKELNIKSTDSIIDLTANEGSFLLYLQSLGYDNLTYCDISQENIDNFVCNDKYKLNIVNKSDYLSINKKYKLIVLSHTLEHLSDLKNIFDNIKLLMDEDSLVYIEVPDMNRIKCNNFAYQELTYEHINFFNLTSLNNLCIKNNLSNNISGTLDFIYRFNILIHAFYGVYKLDYNVNNNNIYCDNSVKKNLLEYINNSKIEAYKIYNQIDKSKKYSLVGIGVYATFFLTIFNDISVNKFYDDAKIGSIEGIQIQKITDIKDNENILILTPVCYDIIYENLIKHNINPKNIVSLKY